MVHHDLREAPHRLDLAADVGREHGAGDDVEGQRHHLGGDVERLRQRAPARQRRLRCRPHGVDERGDALAVEGGRRDAALAPPELALAGEEPVAQERPQHAAQEMALAVVRVIGQQHVLDIFRLVDQEAVQEQDAIVDHVPAEELRHQGRELIRAHPPDELDQAESRRQIGVLDECVRRCRRQIHAAAPASHDVVAASGGTCLWTYRGTSACGAIPGNMG